MSQYIVHFRSNAVRRLERFRKIRHEPDRFHQAYGRDGQIPETGRSHRHRPRAVQRVQVQRRPANGTGRPELRDGRSQVLSARRLRQSVGALRPGKQRRRRAGVRQTHETVRILGRGVLSGAHRQTPVPQSRPPVRGVRRASFGRPAGAPGRRIRRAGGRAVRVQFQAARASEVLAGHRRVKVDRQARVQYRRAQRLEHRRRARERRDPPGVTDLVDRAQRVREKFQRKIPLSGR